MKNLTEQQQAMIDVIIIEENLDELEKDLLSVKRNNGAIYSEESVKRLELKILDFKRSISILASNGL